MAEAIATRDAYGQALIRLAEENTELVVLDADTSSSTRTSWFAERFPKRFFNFGVAEANMIGFAAGLAACGRIPFVSTFAVFGSARVFDQVRTCVCWPNLSVKIVVTHAGISVGEDGASHQSLEDITLMRSLPNMRVVVPADGIETERVIEACLNQPEPFYIRLGRAKFPLIMSQDYQFELGKGVVIRDGQDAAIVAIGLMVSESLKAADRLKEEGINVRVINMSSVKPIDKELIIKAARETAAIVTAEEHSINGGLGGAVAEVLAENSPVWLKRIGIKDVFGTSGTPEQLLNRFEMSYPFIVQAVKEVIAKKNSYDPDAIPE